MRARLMAWLQNVALAGASLLATLAVVEGLLFGQLLKPDDVLQNVTIDGVVRYMPDTAATFRHPDGRETLVTINSDGWNSTRPHYRVERTPGRLRIAVIGDSYVHGAFVDVADGYPEVIERTLRARGIDAEVLRFGIDGAPLSQYLHVLRRDVLRYRPDLVVVGLIHNDFDESYRLLKTRTGSSFMKLALEAGQGPVEIAPEEFRPGLADRLRAFATFRYLYYETNLHVAARTWISRHYWGGAAEAAGPEHIQSAVDIRTIADHARNRQATEYVMGELKALAEGHGFRLLFVMDAVREAIYAGADPATYAVGALNDLAAEAAASLGLPFLDLTPTFRADWEAFGQRLEYAYDWHWNERGNRVVAEAIAQFLLTDTRLISSFVKPVSGRQALAP